VPEHERELDVALAGADLTGPAKLETIGLFSGVVRLFAQTEISQRRAGQDTTQWQGSLAGYLLQIAAGLPPPTSSHQAGVQDRPDSAELLPVTTMPHVVEPPTPMAPL